MPIVSDGTTAIEYFDGFDDYSQAQTVRYWTSECQGSGSASGSAVSLIATDSNFALSSGNGRNATNSLRFTNSVYGLYLGGLSAVASRTAGTAFKPTQFPSATNTTMYILTFTDAAIGQVGVRLNVDGTLSVVRGPGQNNTGTVLDTSTQTLAIGVYVYVEFSATIHNTTGTYSLKVNGTTWKSGASANTRQTANNTCNGVILGPCYSGVSTSHIYDYDDFYIRADSTFAGDVRVETKLPTGNGATNNFTRGGTDSGTNWGQVDENPATDDTDYVQSGTTNDVDLYTYPALTTGAGSVQAVMPCPVLRNDAVGSVNAAAACRSAGTTYPGTTQVIGSTTYAAYLQILGQDPATSTAWTISGVNAAQFGVKKV